LHGGPAEPSNEKLDDELELVTAELPDETAWRAAVERAASILGLATVNPAHNPTAFERLVSDLRERGTALLPAAERLVPLLEQRLRELGADPEQAPRLRTAVAASELAHSLVDGAEPAKVIERFATVEIPTSEQA